MRLNPAQIHSIRETVRRTCGNSAGMVLFGSRLNDTQRGGDVDLLVESDREVPLVERARLKLRLESMLGLPVDLLIKQRATPPTAFQQIALLSGVRL